MRIHPIPLIAIALLAPLILPAQVSSQFQIHLKSGVISPAPGINQQQIQDFDRKATRISGKTYAIIQFEQPLAPAQKEELKKQGIELLDYIPHYAYTAVISGTPDLETLQRFHSRALVYPEPVQKIHPSLVNRLSGSMKISIGYARSFSLPEVLATLRQKNFEVSSTDFRDYHILSLKVSLWRLEELASFPFVEYIEPAPGEPVPLSQFWTQWGRDGIRGSILNAPISQGGKNLKGTGVVIGIGDNADPQQHVDFADRMISRAAGAYNFHGTHVAGIAGGGAIRNEMRGGLAPRSIVISQMFSNIITYAPAYVTDYGMVITNNSYGNIVDECGTFGFYDLYSRVLDQQAFDLPQLQTLFSAGNSGLLKCAPMPDSFRTVLGGYQSAKNIITVGNATPLGYIYQTSSRGPVRDGRIKPEIVGVGAFIESTAPPPFDYYWENTGTSMSSPAVAGGLALLYERYRALHPPGLNPSNALMKALICNSGDDWGNAGPDFTHGFGVANLWRAADMLENNHYYSGNISPGPDQTIPVTVPAGLAALKVMLYWNDPPAAAVSSQTLVNNLDLQVEPPSSPVVLPLILDTASTQVKNPAHNGVDNLNNIEQVVISNPAAGNYTIRVKATAINQNPSQDYVIVYDFVPVETKLMTPVGGETYVHGENVIVQWDSYGDPANTFTLEFYNGSSWSTLKSNIAANKRHYFYTAPDPNEWWVVPTTVTTDQALFRISRNGTGYTSTSLPFVISDTLKASLSAVQCEGYISMDWIGITGATSYEVMMLQGTEMVTVATVPSTTTNYIFSGLSRDITYWVAVRPLIGPGNSPGRRSIALSRKPSSGTCTGTISDNDIKIDSIASPLRNGRLYTQTALGAAHPVTIGIKNLDDAATSGDITVSYTLNADPPVAELIVNPAIAAGATYWHTFTVPANLAAAGSYTLQVSATITGDPVTQNNSLAKVYRQLDNPLITSIVYPTTYKDDFDAAPVQTYNSRQLGMTGIDNYDFINSNDLGRIRTFVNTGIAYSGNRALTLDCILFNGGTIDSLTGTFNMDNFNAATDDIRLDFRYKNHGQSSHAANRVWIRGSDADSWVLAYDLYANQADNDGSYKFTTSIELSDLLVAATQDFSTSFQVRWGQFGQIQTADNVSGAGYTFDDIRLYKVTDDLQMISIDTPIVHSCGLTANTPVKITVRNSSNAVVGPVPVRFRVNGGSWTTENILSIAANSTTQHTFIGTANMAAPGVYLLEAEVVYPTDTYDTNDTLSITLINTPVITVTNGSPYLQQFEIDNGYWYTDGVNSSWEYGEPGSYKIQRAASGEKAWKTRIAGNYNDNEISYLYSPCFNVSGTTNPTLSFSVALDLEDCGAGLCDGAYVEYSKDGITWLRLGANGQGTNWYNKSYTGNHLWSVKNYYRWHVATIPLSVIPGSISELTQLRFRFVLVSDGGVSREGIGIDDVHIYDNLYGIYDGVTMGSPVNGNIPGGTGWIDFLSGGKLVASVNSPVSMGSTDVQAYINTGGVRINSMQYYHDRNITIKPATINLSDSATVRFYFLDSETEALINVTGCGICSKPAMAYELGVTKYSDPDDSKENGTLADNTPGNYIFINSSKTRIIPFDKGYYAEFKVKDFCELWLNDGGMDNNTPLPLKLLSFTARKKDKDALLEWRTTEEVNFSHFEIEVARGNTDYQLNRFSRIGTIASTGNGGSDQYYHFTDAEFNKSGVRYYRLKMIDIDGKFSYSPIRPLLFSAEQNWQLFPNPSQGQFYLLYQLPDGETLSLKLYDANGRLVREVNSLSSGFQQKLLIDLADPKLPPGLYMLEARGKDKEQFFRLIKQ